MLSHCHLDDIREYILDSLIPGKEVLRVSSNSSKNHEHDKQTILRQTIGSSTSTTNHHGQAVCSPSMTNSLGDTTLPPPITMTV
ncbi:hypothetical protein GIB67_042673, partial [Kingdonia uniflora]